MRGIKLHFNLPHDDNTLAQHRKTLNQKSSLK